MRLEKKIAILTLIVLVACAAVHAQQKDPRVNPPVAPLPPLAPNESSSVADAKTTSAATPAATPARPERPASEIEQVGLGLWGAGQSLFTANLGVSFTGDSNASANAGPSQLRSAVRINGDASLLRNWRQATLSMNYSSGGTLYNSGSGLNRQSHVFGFRYGLVGRGWSLTLNDSFSLLPESSFGFWSTAGGVLLPGAPGQVQSQLNPLLVPNQSILTGIGRRVSNTFAGQVSYSLTPRSSLAISSSYGILRGLNSNLLNNHQWSLGTAYSYLWTSRDSVSLTYSHSGHGWDNSDFGISADTLRVGYSRQLTGRLALDVGGGPHISRFRNPVAGSGTRVSSSVRVGLQYQMSDTHLDVSYMRGITGGSGVLLGAHTDLVQGGMSKRLSRMWTMFVRLGYARNVSLFQSTGLTNQYLFKGWHAQTGFSRPVGRYAHMALSYGVNGEQSNSSFCLGTVCGRSALRHQFGLSFHFSLPPIALE